MPASNFSSLDSYLNSLRRSVGRFCKAYRYHIIVASSAPILFISLFIFLFYTSIEFRLQLSYIREVWNNLDLLFVSNPADYHKGQFNVAVCIVGQAMRLETESKLKNLIEFNVDNPKVSMFVVGVLDHGAFYSNGPELYTGCYGQTTDIASIFNKTFRVPGIKDIDGFFNDPKNFTLSKKTEHILGHYRRTVSPTLPLDRVNNHLRQFDHDKACLDRVELMEKKHGVKMDVLVRTRDNAMVVAPFDVLKAMNKVKFRKLVTKGCNGYGGYSDKIWIIPRKYMQASMAHVVEHVLTEKDYLDRLQPRNSEQLLKAVWDHYGVKVSGFSPDELPFIDGRCLAVHQNSTSIPEFTRVASDKDCWPSEKA